MTSLNEGNRFPVRPNAARSLHAERAAVINHLDRLLDLRDLVREPGSLTVGQWCQLFAVALDFKPDLIIELGRGRGNSTCVFTEAAHCIGGCRVISIGFEGGWSTETVPRLVEAVEPDWFDPLEVIEGDITAVDFQNILAGSTRVIFFWDAHGSDLGNFVLSQVFPLLSAVQNIVAVHDVVDARFESVGAEYVRTDGEWMYWQGDLVSPFPELVPLYDFLSRNRIEFATAVSSVRELQREDGETWAELAGAFNEPPADDALAAGYWMYFELGSGAYVFPPRAAVARTSRSPLGMRRRLTGLRNRC